jgi:glutamate synthase (NADPH/NADH) small chain
VGFDVAVEDLRRDFDALCLCGGATKARDLDVPGRDLAGVHFAMEYLPLQNRRNLGDRIPEHQFISAAGKHVVIIGGGDTGADCLGTAHRQGAASVRQFELLPRPPEGRTAEMPWPYWPMIFRTSSAHEEGGERDFAVNTKSFGGEDGRVTKLHAVRVDWSKGEDGRPRMKEIAGSEFEVECDLCLLALGFVHPEHPGPIEKLGLALDARGNVKTDEGYMSSVPGVYSACDKRPVKTLVVWAISGGRKAARSSDAFLMGRSDL